MACNYLRRLERTDDYRESVALDGREGLNLHEEDPAELIVTDLNMLEMDGFSVIEQVRAKTHDVNIIVVSGASQQTERKAIEMVSLCTMSQPVKFDDLISVRQDALSGK